VAYETTYDIWTNNNANEIMLWMNYTGAVAPISSSWSAAGTPNAVKTNISVGGHTWNLYTGSNGSNNVYSLVRTSNTSSGTVDILAILKWLSTNGYLSGTQTLGNVQFGFEITSSSAGLDFQCASYSLTNN